MFPLSTLSKSVPAGTVLGLIIFSEIHNKNNSRAIPLDFAPWYLLLFLDFCICTQVLILVPSRSSRPELFCKKGVLRNFSKFTGKHLCQSLFFNKVAGLRPATLLKRRLWHRCFPKNYVKFLRKPFL